MQCPPKKEPEKVDPATGKPPEGIHFIPNFVDPTQGVCKKCEEEEEAEECGCEFEEEEVSEEETQECEEEEEAEEEEEKEPKRCEYKGPEKLNYNFNPCTRLCTLPPPPPPPPPPERCGVCPPSNFPLCKDTRPWRNIDR